MPQREPKQEDNKDPLWTKLNWTTFIGLLSVSFIAVRLLAVAGGDPETAYAILQAQGTASVVVGTLIQVVGLLTLILIFLGIHIQSNSKANDYTAHILSLALVVIGSIVTIITAPAVGLALCIAITIMLTATLQSWRNAWSRRSRKRTPFRRARRYRFWPSLDEFIIIYAISIVVTGVLAQQIWLPAENLLMENRKEIAGYVLSQSGGTATILGFTGIVQVPSKSIARLTICQNPDYLAEEETIGEILTNAVTRDSAYTPYSRCK
jgi:hypothetical protein